ncbi:hypothetical protein SPFL3102_03590 [Sporomusaceae bacterium FL31]|nr:hypothetical protein SPFL3101_00415 [Sporomusaceae bacterium FL31]GCE35739.1 hypothetical protein SPFL3102_03590 [Sporomusaceae bacterium]
MYILVDEECLKEAIEKLVLEDICPVGKVVAQGACSGTTLEQCEKCHLDWIKKK